MKSLFSHIVACLHFLCRPGRVALLTAILAFTGIPSMPQARAQANMDRDQTDRNQSDQNQSDVKSADPNQAGRNQTDRAPAPKAKSRPKPKKDKKDAEEKTTFTEKVENVTDKVADTIDKTANQIDLKLAGKKYTRKKNESSITIRQLFNHSEGGEKRISTDFGINLRLPNLEKRWQVRFTSYDEQEEARDLRQRRVRTRPRERDPGAALLFFRKLGNIRTTFQPRLELKDPLEMSYLLRFETRADQGILHFSPKIELYADPQKGTGQFFVLNWSVEVAERLELSFMNEEEYRERDNFLNVNHGIALDYSLTDDQGLGLSITTNSTNRPGYHLESYAFSPGFAHEVRRDRLRYIAAPYIVFAKPEAFKGDVGFSAQVELIF